MPVAEPEEEETVSGDKTCREFAKDVAAEVVREIPALRDVSSLAHASAQVMNTGGRVTFESGPVVPLEELERAYVVYVLGHFDGNKTKTAAAIDIDVSTLYRKLARWGL